MRLAESRVMSLEDDLDRLLESARHAGVGGTELLTLLLQRLPAAGGATAEVGRTRLDLDRARRCGHPEVIYAPGKSTEELLRLMLRLSEAGQDVLATRVTSEQGTAAAGIDPGVVWNPTARTVRWMQPRPESLPVGRVMVLTAGTSDRPVAEEACETLAWMRVGHELIADVGVAGPWRLLEQLPRLQEADAVIVAAGMEGALPSVVGGWVSCPVLAVPTSVGYGVAFGGVSALLGMLNSCAANVAVVNIDAGFKAGYLAGLMALGRQGAAVGVPPAREVRP